LKKEQGFKKHCPDNISVGLKLEGSMFFPGLPRRLFGPQQKKSSHYDCIVIQLECVFSFIDD
jgi:hypothetical protein